MYYVRYLLLDTAPFGGLNSQGKFQMSLSNDKNKTMALLARRGMKVKILNCKSFIKFRLQSQRKQTNLTFSLDFSKNICFSEKHHIEAIAKSS